MIAGKPKAGANSSGSFLAHKDLLRATTPELRAFVDEFERGTMLWADVIRFLRSYSKGAGLGFLALGWSARDFLGATKGTTFRVTDHLWIHGASADFKPEYQPVFPIHLVHLEKPGYKTVLERSRYSVVIASPNSNTERNYDPKLLADRADLIVIDGAASGARRLIERLWSIHQERDPSEQTPCLLTHRRGRILLPMFGLSSNLEQLRRCLTHLAKDRIDFDPFVRAVTACRFTKRIETISQLLDGSEYDEVRKLFQEALEYDPDVV